MSRAYFAIFHAAGALLASIGRTARTIESKGASIATHFVKPGRLDAKYTRLLSRTSVERNEADYGVVSTLTRTDVEATVVQAGEFVDAVAKILG